MMRKAFWVGTVFLLAGLMVGLLFWPKRSGGWTQPAWQESGPHEVAEVLPLARSLQLSFRTDPPQAPPFSRLIVSEQADVLGSRPSLLIDDDAFAPWQGTVAIYPPEPGEPPMYPGNVNPKHPERYAQWGELFVYGDPRIIDQLREAWAKGPVPD